MNKKSTIIAVVNQKGGTAKTNQIYTKAIPIRIKLNINTGSVNCSKNDCFSFDVVA